MGLRQSILDQLLLKGANNSAEALQSELQRKQQRDMQRSDQDQALAQLIKGNELEQQNLDNALRQTEQLRAKFGQEADVAVGPVRVSGVDPLRALLRRKQMEDEKLTPGQRAADVTFGKEYAEFQALGGKAGAERNKQELDIALQKIKQRADTQGGLGELANRAAGLLPESARDILTPGLRQEEEGVKQAVMATLRQTLGAQFTEKEGERIFNLAYNPRLPAAENYRRVTAKAQELKNQLDSKAKASELFEQTGSLRGLDATGAQAQQMGMPAGLDINAIRAERARRRGGQ